VVDLLLGAEEHPIALERPRIAQARRTGLETISLGQTTIIALERPRIAQARRTDPETTSLGQTTIIDPERPRITVLERLTTIGPRTITRLVLGEFHAQVPISLIAAKRDVQPTRTDQQSHAAARQRHVREHPITAPTDLITLIPAGQPAEKITPKAAEFRVRRRADPTSPTAGRMLQMTIGVPIMHRRLNRGHHGLQPRKTVPRPRTVPRRMIAVHRDRTIGHRQLPIVLRQLRTVGPLRLRKIVIRRLLRNRGKPQRLDPTAPNLLLSANQGLRGRPRVSRVRKPGLLEMGRSVPLVVSNPDLKKETTTEIRTTKTNTISAELFLPHEPAA
jgi:hypothetical protein